MPENTTPAVTGCTSRRRTAVTRGWARRKVSVISGGNPSTISGAAI